VTLTPLDIEMLKVLAMALVAAAIVAFGSGPFDRWIERRDRR
jgi:hypothetical protein